MISRRSLIAGMSLAACTRKPEEKITIGISLLRISQPVFVAIERGLFSSRKLDVDVHRFDTAQPLADELAANRIDCGGYVAYPILFGADRPVPVRVITAVVEDATHPLSYLLVRKGSGLRGTSALAHRKVGILPTIAYRTWMESVLRSDGVADVTLVPLAPALQVDALANGGVDALFTGDPMATVALERGIAELAVDAPIVPRVLGDPFMFGTFALSEAFVQKRPGAAALLRSALDEAIDRIVTDAADGRAAMKPWLRESERAFADRYPETRYLRSSEVAPKALDGALARTGTTLRAEDVTLP